MPPEQPCPIDCPNRQSEGITLHFGGDRTMHLDPFEILLWLLLMMPIGVAVREAFNPEFTFEKAIGRVGALAALAWGIRKAPTEQIYEWLHGKNLDSE